MNVEELCNMLVDIHNRINQVSVRGDDTYQVGYSLRLLRQIIESLVANGINMENNDENNKE